MQTALITQDLLQINPGVDGERCPVCKSQHNSIRDSRPSPIGRRRRRYCGCGARWTTYEVSEDIAELVKFNNELAELSARDMTILRNMVQNMRKLKDEKNA